MKRLILVLITFLAINGSLEAGKEETKKEIVLKFVDNFTWECPSAVALDVTNNRFFVGDGLGRLYVFRLDKFKEDKENYMELEKRADKDGHTVEALAVSPKNKYLVVGYGAPLNVIDLWDVEEGKCIKTFKTPFHVMALAVSPDEKHIFAGSCGIGLLKIDMETGDSKKINGPKDFVWSMAMSPCNKKILLGCSSTIKIWDIEKDELVSELKGHDEIIGALAVSTDDKSIISKAKDGEVKVWDSETGECLVTKKTNQYGITSSIAFGTDNKILVASHSEVQILQQHVYK